MKRQMSLGMLFTRKSLWRCVGLLLLMAAAQAVLARPSLYQYEGWSPAEPFLDGTWFRLISTLGLLGTAAAVMLSMGGFGSHSSYTVSRLPVRRWTVYAWGIGTAVGMVLLFWAVQLAVMLGILRWYIGNLSYTENNPQTLLLYCYRVGILHSLLPLADTTRWITSICYFLGLGVVTGVWSVRAFTGKWSALPLVLAAAWFFPGGVVGESGWAVFLAVVAVLLALGALWKLWEEDWP